jgi:hypothetical protein
MHLIDCERGRNMEKDMTENLEDRQAIADLMTG